MSDEERRTVVVTAVILLVASLLRLGWEVRPLAPILPPAPIPAEFVDATRTEVEAAERMRTPLAPGERIDPNRDPEVELARLPGVGPALARRILDDRDARGPFRTAADLQRVSGIGPATAERLAPHLDFSAPPLGAAGASPSVDLNSPTALVDLNSATAEALEGLPGIGPALAARIFEHRGRVGRFTRVDDLTDVSGIGPQTLERIRPLVRVGP